MKKTDSNIKSFTLMSVLVGMVISGLMIGFVYYIYTNLNQITHGYMSTHTTINAYTIAKADLNREIEKASKIVQYPNGFILQQNDSDIYYNVRNNQLIKKRNGSELIIFDNIKGININTENNTEKMTSIIIEFLLEEQQIRFYIYAIQDLQNELNLSLINE